MSRFHFQLISQPSISNGMKPNHATATRADAVKRKCCGSVRRILDAIAATPYRDIERDIQRVTNGTEHLSDEVERRIAQHLMRNSSF